MLDIISITAIILLIIATYEDLKTLEIPDWISVVGITIGVIITVYDMIATWTINPLIVMLTGTGITLAFSCLMYYTGQWGGGDAKVLIALGTLHGATLTKETFIFAFLVNLLLAGAIWGLLYTGYLAITKTKTIIKTHIKIRHSKPYTKIRIINTMIAATIIILAIITGIKELVYVAAASFLIGHLLLLVRTIELIALHKWVTPKELVPGDWLVHPITTPNIKVEPGKTGLTPHDINNIKKLQEQGIINKICIKYGMPFLPAFLIGYVITLYLGNTLLMTGLI